MSALTLGRTRTVMRSWLRPPAVRAILRWIEEFIVPSGYHPSTELHDAASRKRGVRVVGTIAALSVAIFVPALFIARVPTDLWLPFLVIVVVTVCVIAWSLLIVRADSRLVPLAVAADALVIASLGSIVGDYFHQIALLYALVVAGHTSIHGYRAGLMMALLGGLLVPLVITSNRGVNLTDIGYAFVYLVGIATIPWIHIRLRSRGVEALEASATKYQGLVEHVPAIVYHADSSPDGACRYVSPRAEQLLGYPAEAWTNDPGFWVSRVHPDDRDRLVTHWQADRVRSGERSDAIEYRMIDATGRTRWVRDQASRLDVSDGLPERWTGFLTDITDRKVLEEQLEHQAFHDPLTGLPNRALFVDRLRHALARADRRREPLAVLFLDLDEFKNVNDGIGHEAGDELLVAVARILRANLRPMDTAARLGGDEFAILLEDLSEAEAGSVAAHRILAALEAPIPIAGREVVMSGSIGVASPITHRESVAEIMRNADSAMYAAKRHGKGRFEMFEPAMQAEAVRRLELAGEMRTGLEQGEFAVFYQPLVRLSDGAITGFEALVRWNHPRRGLVVPDEFISTAEESGQIVALGRAVLEQACRQASVWQDAAPDVCAPTMSVNVSARQFRDPGLLDAVVEALANARLDASALTLEITESTIMEDSAAALDRLERLKALGIRLAIDDFGTGYSSLSYLRRLPVDILKVDKSFIDGILDGGQAFELARLIVAIGQTLRLDVVAEGVEMPAQALALGRMGCPQAQGFHFARPMVADDVTALLTRRPVQAA